MLSVFGSTNADQQAQRRGGSACPRLHGFLHDSSNRAVFEIEGLVQIRTRHLMASCSSDENLRSLLYACTA